MAQRRGQTRADVPAFRDEGEAGAFWDTHSPLDYAGEFQEAKVTFARPLVRRGLTVKLSEDTIAQLRELAHRRGIGPSTLVRMWILEHLHAEGTRGPGAVSSG